ncbi:MAG: NifB/NifX family molybdenum-iron cluster-binding protein [Pseudomonadota bacterium]|nr:NifB/NifX family molybdenum-iron cluster-binding protein [Pseudomonadota bacterium]
METALRIAFATNDGVHVNQHFGSAQGFAIYAIDSQQAQFLKAAQFDEQVNPAGHHEAKLATKITALMGCHAVYCQAVGNTAIQHLMQQGIRPLRVNDARAIKQLIETIQQELHAGSTFWQTQTLRQDDSRFDEMEAAGWSE